MHILKINQIFQRAYMSVGDKCCGGKKWRIMGLVWTARSWGGFDQFNLNFKNQLI